MAAIDKADRSRKLITTYGKASRKYIAVPAAGAIQTAAPSLEEVSAAINSPRTTLSHPSITKSLRSSPALSAPSSDSDVFDIPDDDEGTIAPHKRRKLAHSTRKEGDQILKTSYNGSHSSQEDVSTDLSLAPTAIGRKEQKQLKVVGTASGKQKHFKPRTIAEAQQNPLRSMGSEPNRGLALSPLRNRLPDSTTEPSYRDTTPTQLLTARVAAANLARSPKSRDELSATTKDLESPTPQKSWTTPTTPKTPSDQPDRDRSSSAKSTSAVLTPKVMKMWDGLLGEEEEDVSAISNLRNHSRGLAGHQAQPRAEFPPRTKLIDSLVLQSEEYESFSMSSGDSEDYYDIEPNSILHRRIEATSHTDDTGTLVDIAKSLDSGSVPMATAGSGTGPKITYSRQRSMLAEQDILNSIVNDDPQLLDESGNRRRNRRGSLPILVPLQSLHEKDQNDDGHSSAIRTVHELRQAGANKRFLNEMDDILDRIDMPGQQSSTRRSGLLDLADKMYDKEFYRQFVSNGMDQRLFVHLGQELDVISGFIIVSLLVTVLGLGNTPTVVAHLQRQGISRLLIRLIAVKESIILLAKDRKSNMSKVAQSMLLEQHDRMMQQGVWDEIKAEQISPRIVALRCLELMVRQCREAGDAGDIISNELSSTLFAILRVYSEGWLWMELQGSNSADFRLALSALESHSLKAMTGVDSSHWVEEYLPTVKSLLQIAFTDPRNEPDPSKILLLRLVLNATNNNSSASDVFATPAVLGVVSQAIIYNFQLLSKFLTEDERLALVDHLILMLGVMINFTEWSGRARECLESLRSGGNEPLDDMVQIFQENLEKTSEADSVEDTHLNVAFGYLAVFLGFACLSPKIANRVRLQQPKATLEPLIAVIEEFISHHKKVDDLFEVDVEGYNPQVGLTERLQQMVDSLKRS